MSAPATAKDVRIRLGAARCVLEDVAGKPAHATVSRLQADAMVSLLKEVTLTDVEKADFAGMIVQMAWHNEEHSAKVLAGLAGDSKTTDPARRRRNLQDFTAFVSYGHNHFWTTTQSNTPMTSKLQFLCQHLLKLGLRTPSEHTLKLVCSFWVFQVHSPEVLATLTTQQKAAYLKHVKGAFDGLRRQSGDPAVWIDRLPCEPMMCLQEYPSIFNAIFARGSPPGISPVDVAGVIALGQSYGCRGGVGGVDGRNALPQVGIGGAGSMSGKGELVQISPTRGTASSLERVASQMLGHMQQMAASQQRMFEVFMSGGCGGPPTKLRALQSLETLDFLENRRQTQQAVAAWQPPADEVRQAFPALTMAAETPEETGVLAKVAEDDDGDDLAKMLNALQERKKEKVGAAREQATVKGKTVKIAATTSKPKETVIASAPLAKAAIEDNVSPLPKKAKTSPSPTPIAKVKAASQPPAAKAKASSPSPKAKATAKTKPTSPPTGKASAAAKVAAMSGKAKTKAKSIAARGGCILGCAKCRHSWKGCGQRRDPSYGGFRWNPFCEM